MIFSSNGFSTLKRFISSAHAPINLGDGKRHFIATLTTRLSIVYGSKRGVERDLLIRDGLSGLSSFIARSH